MRKSRDAALAALNALAESRTRQEAAELLGLSVRHVDRLIRTGRLARIKVGRKVHIPVADLNRYVETHYRQPSLMDEIPDQRGA